jgi:hypothetical protein
MKRSILWTLMAGILLAGCAAKPPPPTPISVDVPFSDADFRSWVGSGDANIRGQAFLKTLGGDLKTCAGQVVALFPDNSYSRAALMAMASSRNGPRATIDNRLENYTRSERCDAQGGFLFTKIKPNRWLVLTRITWFAPSASGLQQQGGTLEQSITTNPGENRMILTGADEIAP